MRGKGGVPPRAPRRPNPPPPPPANPGGGRGRRGRPGGGGGGAPRPPPAWRHARGPRVGDHLGDAKGAAEASEAAAELDPENFPEPLEVSDEEFDARVERGVPDRPAKVRESLEEPRALGQPPPGPEILNEETPPLTPDLLGLFVG